MKKIRVAITTGDTDGIGLEVTRKSLNKLGPQKGVQFFVFRDASTPLKLNSKWKKPTIISSQELIKNDFTEGSLVEVVDSKAPALWFETAVKLAIKKQFKAVVTGPLSKTGIVTAGLADLGHTDILKRLTHCRDLHMAFVGKEFNVILNSGHISIAQASRFYDSPNLKKSLLNAKKLQDLLGDYRPIGILGLNPHAGEEGLIGNEESKISDLFKFAQKKSLQVEGPLVPDAAFLKTNWKKYSTYLAAYHDQGLIPFKLVHGQNSGVHITLGIPFIRTSVDHGTAKDIFGMNKANPCSMLEAICLAISLAKRQVL